MYSEKKIEEKCYDLCPELKNGNLSVEATWNPTKVGYDVAIFKEPEKPAIKEFFLDDIIAEACFENGQCGAWKRKIGEN